MHSPEDSLPPRANDQRPELKPLIDELAELNRESLLYVLVAVGSEKPGALAIATTQHLEKVPHEPRRDLIEAAAHEHLRMMIGAARAELEKKDSDQPLPVDEVEALIRAAATRRPTAEMLLREAWRVMDERAGKDKEKRLLADEVEDILRRVASENATAG